MRNSRQNNPQCEIFDSLDGAGRYYAVSLYLLATRKLGVSRLAQTAAVTGFSCPDTCPLPAAPSPVVAVIDLGFQDGGARGAMGISEDSDTPSSESMFRSHACKSLILAEIQLRNKKAVCSGSQGLAS